MVIIVNGNEVLTAQVGLKDLLVELGVEPGLAGVAVAVNDEVIPKNAWRDVVLRERDRVEMVTAVAGG